METKEKYVIAKQNCPKIPLGVLRGKSDREYNCRIPTTSSNIKQILFKALRHMAVQDCHTNNARNQNLRKFLGYVFTFTREQQVTRLDGIARPTFRKHSMGLQKTAHRKRISVGARRRNTISSNVFRMKSARQFHCYIVANQRAQPSNWKFIICSKFGHLQRKRKASSLIQTVANFNNERNVINWIKQCDSYITDLQPCNIKSSLAKIFKQNVYQKAQENKADNDSDTKDDDQRSSVFMRITSLYEDLMSLRHIRIKGCSFQCYWMLHQKETSYPATPISKMYFNYEIIRLRTYCNYPTNGTKSALVLAQNGFVYIGSGSDDKVTCYACQGTKVDWLESEVVTEVHSSMSPDCSMVTGVNSDNVPITRGQKSFDELIQSCSIQSILNTEGCHDVRKEDNETPSLEIQIDAAPIACQEQVNINNDASANSFTKSQTIPNRNIPTFNQQAKNESPSFRPYATLEQAFVTLPLSVQPPSSDSLNAHSSNSPLVLTQPLTRNEPLSSDTNRTERSPVQRNPNEYNSPVSENSSIFLAPNVYSNLQSDTVASQPVTTDPKKPDTSQPPNSISRNTGPTYSELGIVTERPKRPEYAIKRERIKTFSNWPRSHHIQVDDLADAGFYYAGYGDCARCFFCGGGLRNWEDEDDVWVEHARWFPKCAFIRQLMGQNFVDTVQELNKTKDKISYQMVTDEMGISASAFQLDSKSNPLKRDPAVRAMMEFGYSEKMVLEVAHLLKSQENILMSADVLLKKLNEWNGSSPQLTSKHLNGLTNTTTNQDLESIRKMKERNNELRQQTMCKICMDKDVEVVFLPCGHLVSCAECAGALKDCAVCRKPVRGTVRAFLG
ncbi:inhibitor of apoptosis [Biomphalaria pfeifferi]|uniref:Inhibitor of apoptosis n=1 Tax=Biomphalaria pfeifferi TaxID=112525 RepID=A0AAD8EWD0_BIOPF|nr:inhibitor of apoptosis [Biomphalaria pfeifferi]